MKPCLKHTLAIVSLVAAGALATPSAEAKDARFVCKSVDGGHYEVIVSPEHPNRAEAFYLLDGIKNPRDSMVELPMTAAPSGSGIRYVAAGLEFRAKGNEGMIDFGGDTTPCRVSSS